MRTKPLICEDWRGRRRGKRWDKKKATYPGSESMKKGISFKVIS